jgi:hypothetical protein
MGDMFGEVNKERGQRDGNACRFHDPHSSYRRHSQRQAILKIFSEVAEKKVATYLPVAGYIYILLERSIEARDPSEDTDMDVALRFASPIFYLATTFSPNKRSSRTSCHRYRIAFRP